MSASNLVYSRLFCIRRTV